MLNIYIRKTGCIKVTGNDALDFFNRMSTNDLAFFPVGEYRKTVFTNDKGRIIDLVTLLNLDDRIIMLTSPGYEDRVIEHLDKYIIMDDVTLVKENEWSSLYLLGDGCLIEAKNVLGLDLEKNNIVHSNDNVYTFYDEFIVEKVIISGSDDKIKELSAKYTNDGNLTDKEYKAFRIDNGIPDAANEINEQINPVECGLTPYISFTKGCYIGQEVIARLDSQGKIPKQMLKISSMGEFTENDKIFTENKETGFISSAVEDNGAFKGLGFIRSVNLDYDKDYIAKNSKGETKIKISKAI